MNKFDQVDSLQPITHLNYIKKIAGKGRNGIRNVRRAFQP